jgi:hypothetical protein
MGASMNSSTLSSEHRTAIILGAVLGAVILLVIGFMYRGLNYGTLTSTLFWSGSTIRWAILGALLGSGYVYLQLLLKK